MEVISIAIAKGGTGKSSIATSLAAEINSKKKKKVLLIDMDTQANATTCMGIKKAKYSLYHCLSEEIPFEDAVVHTPNGDVLGGNAYLSVLEEELFTNKYGTTAKYRMLRKFLKEQVEKHGYTHCIIDNPPHFGNTITISLMASNKVLIPIIPSELSIEGVMQFYELFDSIKEDNDKLELMGILFNMANTRTREYKRLQEQLKGIFGDKLLDIVIPKDQKVVESQNFQNFADEKQKPCTIAFPKSKASVEIKKLAKLTLR